MVVLVDEGPSDDVRGLFTLEEERDGALRRLSARLPALARSGSRGRARRARVARRLRREGTPVDVLHAHIHRMGWPAVLAGKAASTAGRHHRELERVAAPPDVRRPAAPPSEVRASGDAALVCPVNRRLQHAIESYGVRARFRIVPNTVDTRRLPAGARAPRRRRRLGSSTSPGTSRSRASTSCCGRSRRSPPTSPEADARADRRRPADAGPARARRRARRRARVDFAGAAKPPEIAERLAASDVFVLSSLSENMPLAVLEALCCGLPVVATDVGGVPEAVGDGRRARASPETSRGSPRRSRACSDDSSASTAPRSRGEPPAR